ncbi:hypothetical protein M9Y10_036195 [Tritrichomonas musculus]|uniref:Calpain catalytic domain-containing protein n=1 Tax=Tritrichomonas musculus TaxID=1915356 RepID=A0ABR2GVH9_9EUKA
MLKRFENFQKEAQKYKKILIEYRDKGKVFTDPNFHPKSKIPESKVNFESYVNWVRVDELSQAPLFDTELIKPEFIRQGEIGNCAFVSSLMQLSSNPHLISYLFSHQSDSIIGKEKDSINLKCGAVVIFFHAFSRSTPVLIDTQIPCIGRTTPLFTHPTEKGKSLWFCLVEKAYAKLCGSYSEIASVDFISPIYSLYGYYGVKIRRVKELASKRKNRTAFESLLNYKKKDALIEVSIQLYNDRADEEELKKVGLQFGHSYFVLDLKQYNGKNFIRLRNPWGIRSWKGDYCSGSKLWTPKMKKEFDYDATNSLGSFWMIESDFLKYFTEIDIAKPIKKKWHKRHIAYQIPKDPKDEFPRIFFEIDDDDATDDNEVSMHVIAERFRPLVDEKGNLTPEPPVFAIPAISYVASPFRIISGKTGVKKGKKDWLLVSHGGNPYTEIETVILTFYCEYNFKLYDGKTPEKLMLEDKNDDGTFFHFEEIIKKSPNSIETETSESKQTESFQSKNITQDNLMLDQNDGGLSYYNQAVFFKENEDIPNNKEESAKYMKMAADLGYKDAFFQYAHCLQYGIGVPEDLKESIRYYKMGADKGDEKCSEMYQNLIEKGNGTETSSKCCILI